MYVGILILVVGAARCNNLPSTFKEISLHAPHYSTAKHFTGVESPWIYFPCSDTHMFSTSPKVVATSYSFGPICIMPLIPWATVIFCGRDKWSRSLQTKLWHRDGTLIYLWSKTKGLLLVLPTESKRLPLVFIDKYQEKGFAKSIAAYHVSADVLVSSSKDTTSSKATASEVITCLSIW